MTFDPNHQYLVDARGVKFRFMAIGVEMKIKLDQPTTYFYIFRKWRYVVRGVGLSAANSVFSVERLYRE